MDAFDNCSPDIVWDLNKTPLPFEDESFDFIIANHIMEHIDNWWGAFEEFARILKPNGTLEIWVPGGGSDAIMGYRDHVVEINNCSFFGTFGTYRQGGNAWAELNSGVHANRLKLGDKRSLVESHWWTNYAPVSLRNWMARHLRNIIVEDGYYFRKVTVAEMKMEADKYRERTECSRVVPVQTL